MRENGRFPGVFGGTNDCILEGLAGRPKDCPNNPKKYPDNYRPAVCAQCPGNPSIWQIAKEPLPLVHIRTKQSGETIIPRSGTAEAYAEDIKPSGK